MRVCDGCGAPADEEHIRRRIERLELATRFRPIHIHVLLLGDAPASRAEDYFYQPNQDGAQRSAGAREFLAEILIAAGIPREAAGNEEAALTEFQRRGFYLADAVECPIAEPKDLDARVAQAAPTVAKRIEFSYRPKHVVLIGEGVKRCMGAFAKSSIADRIVLPGTRGGDEEGSSISGKEIAAALARLG
jgi:uracil DNA glycosylase superfamily protein